MIMSSILIGESFTAPLIMLSITIIYVIACGLIEKSVPEIPCMTSGQKGLSYIGPCVLLRNASMRRPALFLRENDRPLPGRFDFSSSDCQNINQAKKNEKVVKKEQKPLK